MQQNQNALIVAKDFIEEMSKQFMNESVENEKDSFIKAGLFVLYTWAFINNKEDTMDELKKESSRLFEQTGNFFHQAEKDVENMKIENPDFYNSIGSLSNEQFDNLLDFVQSKVRI